MFSARLRRLTFLTVLCVPLALSVSACGGGAEQPKTATLKPGPMPDGQEWQGVYFSQQYGNLHLLADGDSVSGGWKTPMGAFGELHGKTEGNLLKYEWKERKIGAVGKDATKIGKGYFVFVVPKAGEAPEIQGQWGLDESDSGNPWNAVKQKNQAPDLSQVKPDEFEGGQQGGGGWDEDKKPSKQQGDSKDEITAPE